jgi:hypothetical protein
LQTGGNDLKAPTLFAVILVFLPLSALQGASVKSQNLENNSIDSASTSKPSLPSEREQHGLRGPVKACVEERIYPGMTLDDGKQIPESQSWDRTEYDEEGRIWSIRRRETAPGHGLDGPLWVTRYTYSPAGLLLKVTSGKDGEQTTSEIVYHYDDQGRSLSIADSRKPDNPITFRYDENGKKTKVSASGPEDLMPNVATASEEASFAAGERAPNLAGGGSATTIYDDQDRPVEIQVREASGELISRTLRIYDNQGNIVEEKKSLDDPVKMIPAGDRNKILDSSGMSLDDLRGEFTKLLGAQSEMFSNAYTYDKHGRKSRAIRKQFNHQMDTTDTTYNEHGDIDVEITLSRQIGGENANADQPRYSEAHYSYVYDNYGNWTDKKVSYRSSTDGEFISSDEIRRTLEYF